MGIKGISLLAGLVALLFSQGVSRADLININGAQHFGSLTVGGGPGLNVNGSGAITGANLAINSSTFLGDGRSVLAVGPGNSFFTGNLAIGTAGDIHSITSAAFANNTSAATAGNFVIDTNTNVSGTCNFSNYDVCAPFMFVGNSYNVANNGGTQEFFDVDANWGGNAEKGTGILGAFRLSYTGGSTDTYPSGVTYTALSSLVQAEHPVGNSSGGQNVGNFFAGNFQCLAFAAATNIVSCTGAEFDIVSQSGDAVQFLAGVTVDELGVSFQTASIVGDAFQISGQGPGAWDFGLDIGNYQGYMSIKSGGTIIGCEPHMGSGNCVRGDSTNTVAHGIDFSLLAFSSDAFKSPNFVVNGSGLTSIGASSSLLSVGTQLRVGQTNLTPAGVIALSSFLSVGKGDNATFIGVSNGFWQAADDVSVDSSHKGVLYGLQLSLRPLVARNNSPYDDVDGLVVQNDAPGVYKATDAVYIGHNSTFTTGATEWDTSFLTAANSGAAYRATGTYGYGFDLCSGSSCATVNTGAMRIPNNVSILAKDTGGSDQSLLKLNSSNDMETAQNFVPAVTDSVHLGAPTRAWTSVDAQAFTTDDNSHSAYMTGTTSFVIGQDGTPRVTITSSGVTSAVNFTAPSYTVGATAGATCSGSPTVSFASVNGIVTHC